MQRQVMLSPGDRYVQKPLVEGSAPERLVHTEHNNSIVFQTTGVGDTRYNCVARVLVLLPDQRKILKLLLLTKLLEPVQVGAVPGQDHDGCIPQPVQ